MLCVYYVLFGMCVSVLGLCSGDVFVPVWCRSGVFVMSVFLCMELW